MDAFSIRDIVSRPDTPRVLDLRARVRDAMERPVARGPCPERIDDALMHNPLIVRKAHAVAVKLGSMPTDLWEGQLFAGSMTLESPRVHYEWGFPDYVTDRERADAASRGMSIHSVFGHIVPDYGKLLRKGLLGISDDARAARADAVTDDERAFLDAVVVAIEGVCAFANRLAARCEQESAACTDPARTRELSTMAANLRQAPAGPSRTFWQAMQSVWLVHMVLHSTMDGNAMGRLDQHAWPLLEADLAAGRLDLERAGELTDCFCLKFNERAKTTEEQRPEDRGAEHLDLSQRTRHYTSSQIGTRRDRLDATNHWLQNIVIGGLTPEGDDGTNPLSHLLLESYRRNRMTNPLLAVRLHNGSPDGLVGHACEVLKDGGGMPALFNDDELIPALERFGMPPEDARAYTNDGCWEVIIGGRTDFRFQRLSLMLCLEWALNRGRSRIDGSRQGADTGGPRRFDTFDDVWDAFAVQLDTMVSRTIQRVVETVDERSTIAPVPLLSALVDGCIESRRDLTAGGARYRTFGMLAEAASHAIDSLTALQHVVFGAQPVAMAELCDALDADFVGHEPLRARLLAAPKYGNDEPEADEMGRRVIDTFTDCVARHAQDHRCVIRFPAGVGTFSWYIGIGEGLGASPDGRRSGEPVASNFSPALGRDTEGLPAAILSYAGMQREKLPAGGPLDLRLARRLVDGEEGTTRMAGLVRAFVESRGSMLTLTVADTEELRAAQRDPERYRSLRVRMGGWCAYFTMLSREQQEHHIRRQDGRS